MLYGVLSVFSYEIKTSFKPKLTTFGIRAGKFVTKDNETLFPNCRMKWGIEGTKNQRRKICFQKNKSQ